MTMEALVDPPPLIPATCTHGFRLAKAYQHFPPHPRAHPGLESSSPSLMTQSLGWATRKRILSPTLYLPGSGLLTLVQGAVSMPYSRGPGSRLVTCQDDPLALLAPGCTVWSVHHHFKQLLPVSNKDGADKWYLLYCLSFRVNYIQKEWYPALHAEVLPRRWLPNMLRLQKSPDDIFLLYFSNGSPHQDRERLT